MRLFKYLSLSGLSENVNKFRAFNIGLVDKNTGYSKIVKDIQEEYKLDIDIIELLKELNSFLNKSYKGKYKFDFCLSEGKEIEEVRITKNICKIKRRHLITSNEFSRMKTYIEKKIKERI